MKINAIDVDATLSKAKKLPAQEKDLSPAFQSVIEVLLMLVSVLLNQITLRTPARMGFDVRNITHPMRV